MKVTTDMKSIFQMHNAIWSLILYMYKNPSFHSQFPGKELHQDINLQRVSIYPSPQYTLCQNPNFMMGRHHPLQC